LFCFGQEAEIAHAAWMKPEDVLRSRLYAPGGMLGAHFRAGLEVAAASNEVGFRRLSLKMSPHPKAPEQTMYFGGPSLVEEEGKAKIAKL
jgi:hypothetical protein